MLYKLNAADRLSLLADHMERTPMTVDMNSSSTCAYGHALHVFGESYTAESEVVHFAEILGIDRKVASYIYCATNWNRERVVRELRALGTEMRRRDWGEQG